MFLYETLIEISKQYQTYVGCHGFEHTERVIDACIFLGKLLGANMDILIPAAILHDVGRGNENHAQHSANMSRKILNELNYPKVDEIIHAIEAHSFSSGKEAKTLESKILSDADKLDAMGAVGIYRAAQYGFEYKREMKEYLNHFHEKLLKLKDLFYTEEARELAEKRHDFMIKYLVQVDRELKGLS